MVGEQGWEAGGGGLPTLKIARSVSLIGTTTSTAAKTEKLAFSPLSLLRGGAGLLGRGLQTAAKGVGTAAMGSGRLLGGGLQAFGQESRAALGVAMD